MRDTWTEQYFCSRHHCYCCCCCCCQFVQLVAMATPTAWQFLHTESVCSSKASWEIESVCSLWLVIRLWPGQSGFLPSQKCVSIGACVCKCVRGAAISRISCICASYFIETVVTKPTHVLLTLSPPATKISNYTFTCASESV